MKKAQFSAGAKPTNKHTRGGIENMLFHGEKIVMAKYG